MIVTLIRHGQIPANINRCYVGCRTDELLTDVGIEQAHAAAAVAPEADILFVSPLTRCRQTAGIIYPELPQRVVDDLREMDFGIFERRTADEMEDFKPYRDWVDGMCQGPIPGGERMADFDDRCCAAFGAALAECDSGSRASFVVHGGTIMSIMGRYNDEGMEYFQYHLNNCEFYECEVGFSDEGRPSLHRVGGVDPRGGMPPSWKRRQR